jgi:hypothetical protein
MFGSTMVLTIGHALDRARDENLVVRLCVGGDWVSGRIVSHDGHGVALLEGNGDLCVLRLEAVSGVRLPRSVETAGRPGSAPAQDQPRVPAQHADLVDQRALATS